MKIIKPSRNFFNNADFQMQFYANWIYFYWTKLILIDEFTCENSILKCVIFGLLPAGFIWNEKLSKLKWFFYLLIFFAWSNFKWLWDAYELKFFIALFLNMINFAHSIILYKNFRFFIRRNKSIYFL